MFEAEAAQIESFISRLNELRACLDVDGAKTRIAELENMMAANDFWDNTEAAQDVLRELKGLKTNVSVPEALDSEFEDASILVEMAQDEQDESMAQEVQELLQSLETRLGRLEINSLFSDPRDGRNAIVSVHPGAGGTESCDWAEMLYRMLVRFCERHDFSFEVIDYQPGDEAGLKSATLKVSGHNAYGNLKSESGVHRLVRISPFDSAKRRHTSFAAIEVLAEVDKNIEVEVREEDLKMDVFRASGAGGQKVNKTSSAVRLTHTPTGLIVSCQVQRSQHQNRATCVEMIRAKLYDIELEKKEAEVAAQRDDHQEVAWGSQIRSYVLHPYQMIKDHRTNIETGNVDRVLEGELDLFIEGFLKWKLESKSKR